MRIGVFGHSLTSSFVSGAVLPFRNHRNVAFNEQIHKFIISHIAFKNQCHAKPSGWMHPIGPAEPKGRRLGEAHQFGCINSLALVRLQKPCRAAAPACGSQSTGNGPRIVLDPLNFDRPRPPVPLFSTREQPSADRWRSIRPEWLGWYSSQVGFYPTHAPVAQRIEQLTTDQ